MGDSKPPPMPAQPLAPGNFDKAWNDPPLFSYNQSGTNGPSGLTSRTSLNKRVGFPGLGAGGIGQLPPGPGLDPTAPPKLHDAGAKPPPCALPPPPSSESAPPSSSISENSKELDEDPSADDVQQLFSRLIRDSFPQKKADDLERRMAMMFTSWREGRLNPRISGMVFEIGKLVEKRQLVGAEERFVTLSADYGGEAGNTQWVLAIRHLLNMVKEKESGGAVGEEGVTVPLLMVKEKESGEAVGEEGS